ncbi:unnamed protein product [Sphagnum tenellum]
MCKIGASSLQLCKLICYRLWVVLHLLLLVLLASSSPSFLSAAQSIPDGPAFPPTVAPTNLSIGELPDALYAEILSATAQITNEVQQNFSYCITDGEKERNEVFGFQQNSTYLVNCYNFLAGVLGDRLCTYSEIKFYFENLAQAATPPPNANCNSTSWSLSCEAGWAASVASPSVNNDSLIIPSRLLYPKKCCAGFFCPRGLSCMMPCPLGASCPVATLNSRTGVCDPYDYQVTPGNQCGGADIWSVVSESMNTFCPAGMYCPTSVENLNCSSGHYCRLGSTIQEKCSHLTSCSKVGLQKQNLTSIGGLILGGLATILFILVTCSDWLMDIKKRRKSKARQIAQQQARERVSGLERWRKAKEMAKLQATNISRTLSKTFSRRRTPRSQTEELQDGSGDQSFNGPNVSAGDSAQNTYKDLYSPVAMPPIDINVGGKSGEVSTLEGQKGKRPPLLVKPLRKTESQIFSYAYGEIEKERVFGVSRVSPSRINTLDTEAYGGQVMGKLRPPIELSFDNLSLFLKGSGKKILSNVTGMLKPGRIMAVMGPSGAGKTTFLNALAGKATQSRTTGTVLINGKPGSIQSYKQIIGFVPQDDIVHGNLTVEENLWFSANYRLPVNMPQCDRVLVVERIIAALGLGPIRDSLVGTVEKRGISGGQRKRVNVGLEMVMEPSLLILDEPTSGLDSTSSRLVLQALRREANMGVNVGVVLHQPSYGLFKMFDDVMFLAKGGFTAYLGPISEVEDYFRGIGLVVPDRINPPDHFMDALEGIVTPSNYPKFDTKNLPVLWMLKKGYTIPPDLEAVAIALQQQSNPMDESKDHINESTSGLTRKKEKAFHQEVLHDVHVFFRLWYFFIKTSLHKLEDKSGRNPPGFVAQYFIILKRVVKQRLRDVRVQLQDYIILLLAGACVGILSPMNDSNLGSSGYFYTLIALALLIMIASLRTFSQEKLQFWRESASGINRVAYFLAKDTVDLFNVLVKPVIYLSMFFYFSNPRSSFVENFEITVVFVYCATGIAYILGILFQPAPAQLWSVFLPILATLIVASKRTGFLLRLTYLSYARYANEAFVIANARRYIGVWVITRCAILGQLQYKLSDFLRCLLILVLYGMGARIIALLCLFLSNRNRQK